jgi:hypothetical protein
VEVFFPAGGCFTDSHTEGPRLAAADFERSVPIMVTAKERQLRSVTTVGVGDLIWFQDPSGNTLGAMRYDTNAD